jgi:eukaryotic-like serine/threonine-protein kinase
MAGPADPKEPTAFKGTPSHAPSSGTEASEEPLKKPSHRPSIRPGGPKALIGQTISDRYRIEKMLGEGGMGAVYQAEHTLMRKRMAIKVLHPEMTRLPEVVARFEREAMAAAHIDHPNVVTATDFGKLEDGSFFLALEFVEGKSLREVIADGRLDLGRSLHIGRQIGAALQRAHSLKIVHRDRKPENVMLVDRDGDPDFVKVLDFGIAKVQIGELTEEAPGGPAQPLLTQAGMVYGTPEYMAPEQALGQPVDPRADLYALGIIMYEMLCGVRPFDAESKVALLGMQVTAPVPPMIIKAPDASVPVEVEVLVKHLLEKEAAARIGDAKEVIEGITNIMSQLAQSGRIDPKYAPAPTSGMMTSPGLISSISLTPPEPVRGPGVEQTPKGQGTSAAKELLKKAETLVAGKSWLVAAGAGTFAILVLVVTIVVVMRGRGPTTDGADADALEIIDSGPEEATSIDKKVTEAIATMDRGDHGTGIKALEDLGSAVEGRADAQRALFKAYAATKNDKEALKAARRWLKADPKLDVAGEKDLRLAVRDSAISEQKPLADDAFSLMESEMGTEGWDMIYDIAYGTSGTNYKNAAERSKALLRKGDRAKMTPALAVTLELQAASGGGCLGIKSMLDRAAEKGDVRTLMLLRQLVAPRVVGHYKKQDTLGCIHGADKPLDKAIASLDERVSKKK